MTHRIQLPDAFEYGYATVAKEIGIHWRMTAEQFLERKKEESA